jgi:hypothetical protein
MKGKRYNITTLSHPLSHTKTLSYIHTIKYLPLNLTTYYLSPILLPILLITYYLAYILIIYYLAYIE